MAPDQLIVAVILYFICKKVVIDRQWSNKFVLILFITACYSVVIFNSKSNIRKPNAYELLGISRKLSTEEIKNQYKQALKFKHPDKNPSPNAEEEFRTIKENFDLIRTHDSRKKYEQTGKVNPNISFNNTLATFYIAWVLVCNVLYFSKIAEAGRKILCIITAIGVYESFFIDKVMFSLSGYFLEMAIFEQIDLIRALMYAVYFLVCSLQSLWVKEQEDEIELKSKKFYEAEGVQIIEAMKTRATQANATGFLKEAWMKAIGKHSESKLFNFLIIVIVLNIGREKLAALKENVVI